MPIIVYIAMDLFKSNFCYLCVHVVALDHVPKSTCYKHVQQWTRYEDNETLFVDIWRDKKKKRWTESKNNKCWVV